ncbi:hypothetical protein M513_04785 [Trichuris suis]|uniref:Uncharacterized protein n=1 Tax=Trichuris suis TaxID=68888 RepID=A0A085MAJ7_9BILA|nr:hypothetical protein M513_04785 [Trichuris suis]
MVSISGVSGNGHNCRAIAAGRTLRKLKTMDVQLHKEVKFHRFTTAASTNVESADLSEKAFNLCTLQSTAYIVLPSWSECRLAKKTLLFNILSKTQQQQLVQNSQSTQYWPYVASPHDELESRETQLKARKK